MTLAMLEPRSANAPTPPTVDGSLAVTWCLYTTALNEGTMSYFFYHTSLKTLHQNPFKIWTAFDHVLISHKVKAL